MYDDKGGTYTNDAAAGDIYFAIKRGSDGKVTELAPITKKQFTELVDRHLNDVETEVGESSLMSYVDPTDGKTYYSFDDGKTFEPMTDEEFEARFPTPNVEWWTYDEYKAWLDNEKVQLQSLLGKTDTIGGQKFTWTQEEIDKTIDREVVAQYIQHPKIAKDFANYLELFYKYRTDYQIEEIFKGNPDEILMKKVSHASFDERLAVLGLLISKVNERIRFAVEKEEEMELLQGTLIRYKESGQAEVSKDALELLEEVTAGLLFEEKQKKEAELLSRRQEQNYRRAGTLLETYLQRLRLEGSMDFETAFAKIKEWFEEENQKYLQMGQTAEQYLEYAFDFLEGTGLTGQEMVIFITELNSNARSVAFLQECESERYFRYNKELLFSEKREKILEKLN